MKIRKKAYRDGIGILKKELRREKGIAFPLGWVPMPIEFAVASERERERLKTNIIYTQKKYYYEE